MEMILVDDQLALKEKLLSFGSTDERAFEDAIAKMMTQESASVIEDLHQILQTDENLDLRFRAFFGITLHHRRQNDHSKFKAVVDQYIEQFRGISLHLHVLSLMHKAYGDRDGILKSIEYSSQAIIKLNRHVGVLHNYCESVVTAMEEGLEIRAADRRNASSLIETVIAVAPDYAKFYCTRGRILAQNQKFEEAKLNILQAMDLETSTSNDYALRLNNYQNVLLKIKTLELYESVIADIQESKAIVLSAQNSIEEAVTSSQATMESMKAQNLQMLAFFTAIISFIIGSINILSNQSDFTQAAMLILVLAGAMVLVNVAFSILISSINQAIWKYIAVVAVGLTLIATGLLSALFR